MSLASYRAAPSRTGFIGDLGWGVKGLWRFWWMILVFGGFAGVFGLIGWRWIEFGCGGRRAGELGSIGGWGCGGGAVAGGL